MILFFLKGFGEDNIKQQLQAVAEGVAASVLQPPFPEKPAAFSGDHIDSHGTVIDVKVQVGDVSIFAGLIIVLWLVVIFWFTFGFRMKGIISQTKQARGFKF